MKVIKPVDFPAVDGSLSRSTTATYIDNAGIMQTAAINAPRLNYNPDTLRYEGLLFENASTNLLLYSSQFDQWTNNGLALTVNNSTAPDGTLTAETTVSATGTRSRVVAATEATTYTYSLYVKPTDPTKVIRLFKDGAGASATLDIVPSSLVNSVNAGNGWYRIQMTFIQTVTGNINIYLTSLNTDLNAWWGAQLEVGSRATSYIPTVASTVTRAADVITGTGLIQTTVTDPNALYSSGTTYGAGVTTRYSNRLWLSLQATNLNHQPDTSPTWWSLIGPDNLHAAFDTSVSTVSSATASMIFTVKPGAINSLALITLKGAVVEVAVTDQSDGLIYSNKTGLTGAEVFDWYQYFFYDPLMLRTQVVYTGLPSRANALVSLKITGGVSELISIAQAIYGTMNEIGGTQYGASAGIVDYSIKETDTFGNTTFVERPFSKRMSANVHLANNQINRAQNFLYSVRAKPSVWIASDDPTFEEALIVYGYYKEFSLTIAYPTHSIYSLDIEGLA